ncbi:MAG TPA: UDP-N-acetylglucosamine--N-acetylmuramyl-(pentapeptide) pyrophosphoryl-undecaprenol N-acetylglucosamine transferase [Acidimicrobiales bacterium]|nr:UDP-N-acetylglucosamine--N-acetylmuramyl-(pentapeptide) pyrophosphoryl-undecaprenol N-acetylglucosamine transferase [Acidimicrobiales bacterium]
MAAGDLSFVIAAGGTGGHIYPGLALAEAIRRARPEAAIAFAGTSRGLEGRLVPEAGHPLHVYGMVQFAGRGWRKALVPLALGRASLQARSILRRASADVAVSMGGYTGIPLVVGARLARVPSLIHEPGAVPGKANTLAARFTRNVATSFPQTRFGGTEVRHVGYPLRTSITSFDRDALRADSRRAFGLANGTAMVLVTGGSQGAMSLNRLALGLAERWAGRDDIRIVLKAGARSHEEVESALTANPGGHLVDLVRYIDRMDHAYAAADVAVCRAGAGTVTELAIVGLPSVLVPYPHDEHDEQVHNAEPLVASGGAVLVRDHEATAEVVGPVLEARLGDPTRLTEMQAAMRASARPHAADDLAAWAIELAERGRR